MNVVVICYIIAIHFQAKCKAHTLALARHWANDISLDTSMHIACAADIAKSCTGVSMTGGEMQQCLLKASLESGSGSSASVSQQCQKALRQSKQLARTLEGAIVVFPLLEKACKEELGETCKGVPHPLQCLLNHAHRVKGRRCQEV